MASNWRAIGEQYRSEEFRKAQNRRLWRFQKEGNAMALGSGAEPRSAGLWGANECPGRCVTGAFAACQLCVGAPCTTDQFLPLIRSQGHAST